MAKLKFQQPLVSHDPVVGGQEIFLINIENSGTRDLYFVMYTLMNRELKRTAVILEVNLL